MNERLRFAVLGILIYLVIDKVIKLLITGNLFYAFIVYSSVPFTAYMLVKDFKFVKLWIAWIPMIFSNRAESWVTGKKRKRFKVRID